MIRWLKQLFCKHPTGQVLAIAWDGETTIRCAHCGKTFTKALS